MARGQGDNLRTGRDGASGSITFYVRSALYGRPPIPSYWDVVVGYRTADGRDVEVSRHRYKPALGSGETYQDWFNRVRLQFSKDVVSEGMDGE